MIIGLCGMSGAGKTTASEFFKDKGYYVINCDEVARDITSNNKECLLKLKETFGDSVINADGSLNRKALGNIVFNSKEALGKLNSITHPLIISEVKNIIEEKNCDILLDAPTLFESGADKLCDKITAVTAETENCIQRIITRDGISYEEAKSRISSQPTENFYNSKCDVIIKNNGSREEFCQKLEDAFLTLK